MSDTDTITVPLHVWRGVVDALQAAMRLRVPVDVAEALYRLAIVPLQQARMIDGTCPMCYGALCPRWTEACPRREELDATRRIGGEQVTEERIGEMIDLEALALARQRQAGQKYVMPDGTNQAMYRDNGLDVLEELADAQNIMILLRKRMKWAGVNDMRIPVARIFALLSSLAWEVNVLRSQLPPSFRHDSIPVERILPEAER